MRQEAEIPDKALGSEINVDIAMDVRRRLAT